MKNFFKALFCFSVACWLPGIAMCQQTYVLRADRVFDGQEVHAGWVVVVSSNKIQSVGDPAKVKLPKDATVLTFPGCTLLPGLIEAHSHLLLHPYNETPWDEQVLKESDALRVARATVHARKTLEAGFTTVRDLGTEGAGYSDVGLRDAVEQGIIPGPRMIVAGRAIVATGSYGPKGFDNDFSVMIGAQEADGDALIKVVREQIGKGVDVIKVYADYRWGRSSEPMPTFTQAELTSIVETASSSGRPVVAHASTAEGMRRATLAGVSTIEHGDEGTAEVFRLMKEHGVALCPTLAAGEAVSQYRGWKKGVDPDPARIVQKKASFDEALKSGVTICAGGDVGVFPHGDNVRELELMVEYGMAPVEVLRSATRINAETFGMGKQVGSIAPGFLADLVVVQGNPAQTIQSLRKVQWVMKDGMIALQP